ncbi:MAG: N-acetyltransferase family protein [Chloroflexi bacterium]|nr:MAG: N-acetyltransferase family protein [Chloroflexota bacterium]
MSLPSVLRRAGLGQRPKSLTQPRLRFQSSRAARQSSPCRHLPRRTWGGAPLESHGFEHRLAGNSTRRRTIVDNTRVTAGIRLAIPSDLQAILDIYNEAVLNSTATFDTEPRTMEVQKEWARQFDGPFVLLVAQRAGQVVGWGCLHPFGGKPGYRFTAEDSVYVRSDQRGSGTGRLLLAALVESGRENGLRTIIARIAGDNPASVRLHEAAGFQHVGREREVGQKFNRWLDVVVMQMMLRE